MQLISETLKKNKQQISELEEKLKKSGIQSSALRKTISRLSSELDQKANMIVTLQEDLAKKNVRIQELDEMVASLNEDVEDLSTTTAAQSEKLQEQDKQLHTAYYCFGTAKELKDQKILSGGGLFAKSKVEIQSPGRFLRICEGRGRQYDIEDHGRKSVLEPWQVFGD